MAGFNEVRFPTDVALGARGGPERRTDVVTLRSGAEERNAVWADGRRKYQAGYGVKRFAQLEAVRDFFEAQRGRLYGFRWKDRFDYRSCPSPQTPSALDVAIGTGDGRTATFQLVKLYGAGLPTPYTRTIAKPVPGTVRIGVNGSAVANALAWTADTTTGLVTFLPGHVPPAGAAVTAGFEFDVPVRFDTDYLEADLAWFEAGQIPNIPIVEIRP